MFAFTWFRYQYIEVGRSGFFSVRNFFKQIIWIQVILALIQILRYASFISGDYVFGSLKDAHKLGLYFTVFVFVYLFENRSIHRKIIAAAVLLFAAYMTDAKAITLIFLAVIPFYGVINRKYIKRMLIRRIYSVIKLLFILALLLCIVILVLNFYTINSIFHQYASIYWDSNIFGKFIFMERVFIEMLNSYPMEWLFGTGPGTLGTRSSNIVAYDTLYKPINYNFESIFPAFSSFWTRKYLGDLWTKDIHDQIGGFSAILVYPFNGISSVKGELGLIGALIFFFFFFSISRKILTSYKKEDSSFDSTILSYFFFVFPFLMILDNYQEMPQIIVPMILYSAVILAVKSNIYERPI